MNSAREIINEHLHCVRSIDEKTFSRLEQASDKIRQAHLGGNKAILFGNGGSAADAQHIAAEFVVKFQEERKSLAALALTTDTSVLTAIGNNFGFEHVFSRQIESLANEGDIAIGISTSGRSRNVIKGIGAASQMGCLTIALTGGDEGEMGNLADIHLSAPSLVTARIQEIHILFGHVLCALAEQRR